MQRTLVLSTLALSGAVYLAYTHVHVLSALSAHLRALLNF